MASCDYEAISALVDDELEEAECQQVLDHMSACLECRQLFERFHTAQNLVRGEGKAVLPKGFHDRILAVIAYEGHESSSLARAPDGEPVLQYPRPKPRWRWAAVAAGAGAIVTVTALFWSPSDFSPAPTSTSSSFAQSSQENTSPKVPRQDSQPDDEAAIKRYLSVHSSFVSGGPRAKFQRARVEVSSR